MKSRLSVILEVLMKPAHNPRSLVVPFLILVAVAFLTGALRLFRSAQAAVSTPAKVTVNDQIMAATGLTLTPAPTDTDTDLTPTPVPAQADTDLPPQSTPTVVPVSADTTGIIALAIVIVATVLVGAAWGVRRSPKKETPR